MNKPYDASLKQLLADFAADWTSWLAPRLGLAAPVTVESLDADLSSVQLAADKVFRLQAPSSGLLHIEAQASWDGTLPERLLKYNVLLHERHGGPVYSVVLLLRREANAPNLTGVLQRTFPDGREALRFVYQVVRVWELSAEEFLAGGIGAMPLAVLTDDAGTQLERTVMAMDDRLRDEKVSDETRQLVLATGYLLLGMRYDKDVINEAYARIPDMEESTTYMAILNKGMARGRDEGLSQGLSQGLSKGLIEGDVLGQVKARQEAIIDILRERFGSCPPAVEDRIRATLDPDRLKAAVRQAVRIDSADELIL
jgi:predicted transposase YdaD